MVIDPKGAARRLNQKNQSYLRPCDPASYEASACQAFRFSLEPKSLVLAFSDGIDECHYRRPKTSVQLGHIEGLWAQAKPDPMGLADRLMELALRGVEGHPGGQDHIALGVAWLG